MNLRVGLVSFHPGLGNEVVWGRTWGGVGYMLSGFGDDLAWSTFERVGTNLGRVSLVSGGYGR